MSLLSSGVVTGDKVATLAAPWDDSGDQAGRREQKVRTASCRWLLFCP